MQSQSNKSDDRELARWRAHRATEVVLDDHAVFQLRTPSRRSEQELVEEIQRFVADPDTPPEPSPREGFEYEPLEQRTLPNALARIATAADPDAECNRSRRRKRREHTSTAGKSGADATWLAARAAVQAAERAAIKEITFFYRHYGELGFQELKPRGRGPKSGEPLGWVVAEANTVSFALQLIDALNRKDIRDLKAALGTRRLPDRGQEGVREGDLPGRLVRYAVCRGAEHHGRSWDPAQEPWPHLDVGWYDRAAYRLLREDEAALMKHAGVIVADLIKCHLPGQSYDFFFRDGRFVELPEAGPLLRAVWLHVKNTATDRAEVRRCRECGAPFLVTDRRQQFCPPEQTGGKSRCLARLQMRRLRREGQGLQQGEGGQM